MYTGARASEIEASTKALIINRRGGLREESVPAAVSRTRLCVV